MKFYPLFFVAISFFCYAFFHNTIIAEATGSAGAITGGDLGVMGMVVSGIFFVYKNRHLPGFGRLWTYIALFLIILVGTIAADNIKNSLKKWWNS
jgi:hypothetical protein